MSTQSVATMKASRSIYACRNILLMRGFILRCLRAGSHCSHLEGNLQPKQPIVQFYSSLLNHTVVFILTQAVGGIIIYLGAGRDVLVGLRGLRVHALGTAVAFTHEGLVGRGWLLLRADQLPFRWGLAADVDDRYCRLTVAAASAATFVSTFVENGQRPCLAGQTNRVFMADIHCHGLV